MGTLICCSVWNKESTHFYSFDSKERIESLSQACLNSLLCIKQQDVNKCKHLISKSMCCALQRIVKQIYSFISVFFAASLCQSFQSLPDVMIYHLSSVTATNSGNYRVFLIRFIVGNYITFLAHSKHKYKARGCGVGLCGCRSTSYYFEALNANMLRYYPSKFTCWKVMHRIYRSLLEIHQDNICCQALVEWTVAHNGPLNAIDR